MQVVFLKGKEPAKGKIFASGNTQPGTLPGELMKWIFHLQKRKS